jgi:hypothetical protein
MITCIGKTDYSATCTYTGLQGLPRKLSIAEKMSQLSICTIISFYIYSSFKHSVTERIVGRKRERRGALRDKGIPYGATH